MILIVSFFFRKKLWRQVILKKYNSKSIVNIMYFREA